MAFTHPTTGGDPHVAGRPLVATYRTYEEAQRAVDYLSDEKFPVQKLGILGRDLRIEEAVLGRLDYRRAALAGLVQGIWFGFFVGIVLSLLNKNDAAAVLSVTILGAIFGVVFGLVSHAMTGGHRDFVSRRAVTATSYDVVCTWDSVELAKQVLAGMPAQG